MVLITALIRLSVRFAEVSGIEMHQTGIETPDLLDHLENDCISGDPSQGLLPRTDATLRPDPVGGG